MTDWADEKAEEIIIELREYTHRPDHSGHWTFDIKHGDAVALIAAKLRMIRQEGVGEGIDQASKAMDDIFKAKERAS